MLQVIDVLLLLILHATNSNHSRRGAERLLRLKVRTGLITEDLLQKTFKGYAQVCTPRYPLMRPTLRYVPLGTPL